MTEIKLKEEFVRKRGTDVIDAYCGMYHIVDMSLGE